MHIAGGLYLELCSIPAWRSVFGSGGRASAAVSASCVRPTFHTYADARAVSEAGYLERLEIDVRATTRPHGIAFAYFHPLSRPHVYPAPEKIAKLPPLQVDGSAVLRFGFLEGSASVRAQRAVYDPQTWRNPEPFGKNGSVAEELAVVLNELELKAITGEAELQEAAKKLFQRDNATIVIAKLGVAGALVMQRGLSAIQIPAYRSSRVFKIGTGDVYSGLFTCFWAEQRVPAVEAADLASRGVARYCETMELPVSVDDLKSKVPLSPNVGKVMLLGASDTIGRRFTLEEAHFVLRELGAVVDCPTLGGNPSCNANAVLILADGFEQEIEAEISKAIAMKRSVVVFRESAWRGSEALASVALVTDDFCSSMYFAAWASSGVQSADTSASDSTREGR